MNRGDAPGRSAFSSNLESLSRWRPYAASACGLLIFLAQIFDAGSVRADSLDMTESLSSPPRFTGTLLSTRGRTIDQGHMVVQPYVFLTRFGGLYNDNWLLQSASTFHTTIQQTYFLYGLTSRMDLEVAPQWLANSSQGESTSGFGDLPISLGFQLIRDREEWWFPDLRLWIQEVFPTGRHTNLDPKRASVETTGGGSFATMIGLGIQKLYMLGGEQAFRYRLNLTYGFFEATNVSGFNAYGGGFGTEGHIQPGTVTTVTMAGEYSLTRHWLLALDISCQTANATRFSGSPGVGLNGEPAQVGKGSSNLMSVAPAVEYIYNEHLGLIGGPWISVTGRNAASFVGAVLAVYLFF